MAFKLTKDDLKKSQLCPVGMHLGEMVEVEDEYTKDNGCTVQPVSFETKNGHQVKVWFNSAVTSNLIEFVEAADNVKLAMDTIDDLPPIDVKAYLHKPVAFSVSHQKTDKGKIVAQIDNFYSPDKVPF